MKIDTNAIKRVESVDYYQEPNFENKSPEVVYFETNCMRRLEEFCEEISAISIHPDQSSPIAIDDFPLDIDSDANEDHETNLKALEGMQNRFGELLRSRNSEV